MDKDSVKDVLREMIDLKRVCNEYLRIAEEKKEPFKRLYSTHDTHEMDLREFSMLIFEKMQALNGHSSKCVSFSLHHLAHFLDNCPDPDDSELLRNIQWVTDSYTGYIIDLVSQHLLEE